MDVEYTTQKQQKQKHGTLAVFWTILGVLATIAVFPYLLELNSSLLEQVPFSLPVLILIQSLQTALFLFIGSYAGLRLGASIGLDSPLARGVVYRLPLPELSPKTIVVTIVTGLWAGLLVIGLDLLVQPFLPVANQGDVPSIARWKGFLASFYGGIAEELLVRLFLMTLIAWIIWKIFMKGKSKPITSVFWAAIVIAAILFGAGHLPAASLIWTLTPIVVLRTVLLNAIPGIAFGFLYWKQGLEYAMLAHFCADIVLHVVWGG
jgi:membrane protease YdiL (CAAX protease family)